jgi:hypothetical protein
VTRAALLLALLALGTPEARVHAPGQAPLPTPAPAPLAPPPPRPPVARERGVALGMFAEDVSFSYGSLLAEIVALGATHIALVVPLYQTDGASTELSLDTRLSPTLETVADTVRLARRDGLEVMIFPIVRLSAPRPGEWRGTLAPRDRDAWFASYAERLGDLAAIAAVAGAGRLVVGSELSTLDTDLERWSPIVDAVRSIFHGKLVYSANWDHYQRATLFDLVDEDGISGYFGLREPNAPDDDATVEAGWRRVRQELETWRAGRDEKPFIFTELGYRSRAGATATPWDEGPGGKPDLDEQRRGFAAFRRAWTGSSILDGLYIWNWYGYGGPDTTSYTPRGKPAEAEVRALLDGL